MMPLSNWSARSRFLVRSHTLAILALFIFTLLFGFSLCAQSNAITLPRNLGELVRESDTVIQGLVTNVGIEPHAQLKNLMTVVVTIRVEDTLKGNITNNYTFRQAVIDRRDLQDKMGYRPGQHVLMILFKASQFGLASPAGMEQGHFRIAPGINRTLMATNGFGNAGLFRGLASQLKARGLRLEPAIETMIKAPGAGPVSLEHLKSLIRTIASTSSTK